MFKFFKPIAAVLLLVMSIFVTESLKAQERPKIVPVGKQIRILQDKLKLTAVQVTKIRYILEDQREEFGIAANENRGNNQAMDDAIMEIIRNTDVKIKEVLTEKQIEIFDGMIEQREAQLAGQKDTEQ